MSSSNIKTKNYQQPDLSHWNGRVDSEIDSTQFRYHQVVKCIDIDKIEEGIGPVLLGFSCDEGVKRNKGRIGASEGPNEFRSVIGSLSWHGNEEGFLDAGNIKPISDELESVQIELGNAVHQLLKKNKRTFVIGGGHETAYGHYLGIAAYLKEEYLNPKLGILNIDAHFDLREHNGKAHSGSPFLQAHEHAEQEELDLSYFVYGINRHNNTKSLFNRAEELGVRYCTNREVQDQEENSFKELEYFIKSRSHIYLTICLDVFKSSIAPGVSAVSWNGIDLKHALRVIDLVKQSGKLISMDVCELNPLLDQDHRTAKVAGTIFSEWLS